MKASIKNVIEMIRCANRLRPHMRGGRYLVMAVLFTSVLAAVLDGLAVSSLVPLLSLLLGGDNATPMRPIRWVQTALPGHHPYFYVFVFCLLVMGAIITKNAVLYLSLYLAARLKRRMSVNLRDALFQKLHNAELSLFEQRTVGELANVCMTETSRTISTVDLLLLIGQRVSIGTFYFIILLTISWQLTLMTILLAAIIGMSISFLHRRMARSGKEITEINQKFSSHLMQSFGGIRVVRATNSQAREVQRFHELNDAQARVEEKTSRYSYLLMPIAETAGVTGAMIIVGSAYYFYVSTKVMLPTYLPGFGFILLRLLPIVNQLYGLQGHILYLAPGVHEVERWLGAPDYPRRPFGQREFPEVKEMIRFEKVGYTYPNGTVALQDITFEVPAGKTVALVGPSGSGKSTLSTLLLRLRQPGAGRIVIDGVDYWEFSSESWHKRVAAVEQEAFLFHDSMAKNISYGHEDVTPEQIQQAVKVAHLEDVVADLPDGLDTVVGERGTLLSGGQRQRLAIARAMVRDPKLLILDEATSALDNLSEREVQAALEKAVHGRTVIVIAHRLSTIRNADHIVVLDGGRVVEQGGWAELEARGGMFEKLVQLSSVQH